jgi:DeoR/GlpR family transcriptional regulator of sugar metabolism
MSRINEIKEILKNNTRISIADLCNQFGVSNITIRNDLTLLEKEGFLYRTHGGAVLRESRQENPGLEGSSASQNLSERLEKMASLASVAASYIKNDTWIYISSGLTGYELAKQLLDRRLNVVTGGLDIAILLSGGNSTTVFVPGGVVVRQPNGHILRGDWYLRALDEMRFDQAFISVSGVNFDTGFSVGSSTDFLHMQKIKQISRETIVVVDSTKFNYRAFMPLCDITYADTIITNRDIPDDYREFIVNSNIKLLTD